MNGYLIFQISEVEDTLDIALANGSYYAHEQVQWINDALVISIKNENNHQEGRGLIVLEGIHLLKK